MTITLMFVRQYNQWSRYVPAPKKTHDFGLNVAIRGLSIEKVFVKS